MASPELHQSVLKSLLAPRVRLSRPFKIDNVERPQPDAEAKVRDLVDWEVVLATDHAKDALKGLADNPQWRVTLELMLPDFTSLLRDALDLMCELDGANDRSDLSYIAHPSISEHEQNRDFRDWTFLVDLTRDAWVAVSETSPALARAEVKLWLGIRYPLFRRLAFFAATHRVVFSAQEALEILLEDVRWLWSLETQHEATRLVASLAPDLNQAAANRLQRVILNGPDRGIFRDDIAAEVINRTVDREIWRLLVKFRDAGGRLSAAADAKLAALGQAYPVWQPGAADRDEFPFRWVDGREWGTFTPTPVMRRELMEWLREHQFADDMNRDDWHQRCKSDFSRASAALLGLAAQGQWYTDRWQTALHAWTEIGFLRSSWRWLAHPLTNAPDDLLRDAGHALSSWLEAQAKTFVGQEQSFFTLSRRIVLLYEGEPVEAGGDIVFRAINHPLGHTVQALLNWWFRMELRDGQGLPEQLADLFTDLSNTEIAAFRYARVLLGAHLISLFRVDPGWTVQHLIPLLDWRRSEVEAEVLWKGFLWAPRLYRPLMAEIKAPFLTTVRYFDQLGDHGEQYAALLTYAVLEVADLFTPAQQKAAIAGLPEKGLRRSAQTVVAMRSMERVSSVVLIGRTASSRSSRQFGRRPQLFMPSWCDASAPATLRARLLPKRKPARDFASPVAQRAES